MPLHMGQDLTPIFKSNALSPEILPIPGDN